MQRTYDVARDEAAHAVPDHRDALQARRVAHIFAHLRGEPLAARVDALECLPQQAAAVSGLGSNGSCRATCFVVMCFWSLPGCQCSHIPLSLFRTPSYTSLTQV